MLRLAVLLILLVGPSAASASIVEVVLEGTVDTVDELLADLYQPADPVSMRFRYDTNVTGSGTSRRFYLALVDLAISVGDQSGGLLSSPGWVSVVDSDPSNQNDPTPFDEFFVEWQDVSFPLVAGLSTPEIYLGLLWPASTYPNKDLPTTLLFADLYEAPYWHINYNDPQANRAQRVTFTTASMSSTIIPEPSTALLVGLGLAVIAANRARTSP